MDKRIVKINVRQQVELQINLLQKHIDACIESYKEDGEIRPDDCDCRTCREVVPIIDIMREHMEGLTPDDLLEATDGEGYYGGCCIICDKQFADSMFVIERYRELKFICGECVGMMNNEQ